MPSAPPRLALALVVHGSGIAEHATRRRPVRLRGAHYASRTMRIAVVAPGVVPRSADGLRRDRARRRRCSPTASSTPATTSRCSRAAARAPRPSSSRRCPSRPTRASSATPGTTRYHALVGVPAGRRLRRRARPRRRRRAGVRRDARRPTRRSCTRCTDRGPTQTRLLYERRRASTCTSSRSATRNAPTTPTCPYAGIVHNGIDLAAYPYRDDEGRLPRLHRARESRQGTEGSDHDRAARRPAAADDPEAQRAARARRTSSTRSSRCSRRRRAVRERVARDEGRPARPRARDGLPDPLARAVRARDGRGDGVRHAGRHHELGRGARARRRRRHRLPARRRRRPRRTRSAASADLDPAACRARVEERFSAAAMVRGYEAVFDARRSA